MTEITIPSTPEGRREVIREGLENLIPIIANAYQERDWEYFDYASWNDYLVGEFGGPLILDKAMRQDTVPELHSQGMSQSAIAEALGVSRDTVQRDLQGADIGTLPETIKGTDGKEYPATITQPPHVSRNTGEFEWYTPEKYIEAARRAMGGIDLDPASSAAANEVVRATTFYTQENDGLAQPWFGRVWLNPPYSQPLMTQFAEKVVEEYVSGNIDHAIVLVNNATETGWFQNMARASNVICFPEGRVKYWRPDGETSAPLQGQAILYMGGKHYEFIQQFAPMGLTVLV